MKVKYWVSCALLGACLGAAFAWFKPRQHSAQVTLYFPGVQSSLFLNLVHALQAEPDSLDSRNLVTTAPDICPVAKLIFESDAAWKFAVQKCLEERGGGQPAGLPGELMVTSPEASTLQLRVQTRSAENADVLLQGLLDYYSGFIKKTPLTRIRATKSDVDSQLTEVRRQLTKLEEELSRSKSLELRTMGEATLKVSPKLLTQVWLKRADETRQTAELLSRLRKFRGKTPDPQSEQDLHWLNQWAAARQPDIRRSKQLNQLLATPVLRRDLLGRVKLERNYSEALMRHRALVLQQSFLATWQNLESPSFEVIAPISVSKMGRVFAPYVGLGTMGGLLFGLLIPSRTRRESRG